MYGKSKVLHIYGKMLTGRGEGGIFLVALLNYGWGEKALDHCGNYSTERLALPNQ